MVSPTSSLVSPRVAISTSWIATAPLQARALHDPALHEVNDDRGAADLDDVSAEGDHHGAIATYRRDHGVHGLTEGGGAEVVRQRVEQFGRRGAGRR